jgi:hypothetical protein
MSGKGSERETVERDEDTTDPREPLIKSSEPSIPPEVPEADLLEQSREADQDLVRPEVPSSGLLDEEASEADVLEQAREVPFDDDSYR